jgi:hypothetical protein
VATRTVGVLNGKPSCSGSGKSDADDYDAPHNIDSATEDVLNLVQAICPAPYVAQPTTIVGYGALGAALALNYTKITSSGGQLTTASHSEISGAGAITPPTRLILLSDTDEATAKEKYVHDAEVSRQLRASAVTFLQLHNGGKGSGVVEVTDCRESSDALLRLTKVYSVY